ncbi:MAG: hypothetical protein MZV70_07860 [Desulfobacterales bacterium]|nr:hypothetical protein [Desulfobacterales bacterium]
MDGDWQLGTCRWRLREEARGVRRRDAREGPGIERAVGDVARGRSDARGNAAHVAHQRALLRQEARWQASAARTSDRRAHRRTERSGAGGTSASRSTSGTTGRPHLRRARTRYFLKDALGIAAGIHEYSRQADIIFMANYAQTVNVIGAIKTTKTAAAFDTTGLVLKLYRAHFGQVPVTVTGAPAPLDVAAAWREDRSALTLAIVNPTAEAQVMALQLKGAAFAPAATLRRIAGTDPMAYNEPGKPPAVKIEETAKRARRRQAHAAADEHLDLRVARYFFFPASVSRPFCFQSLSGQNSAVLNPASSASFAACELLRPVFQVKTRAVSFGISLRRASRSAKGMWTAPLMVSWVNCASSRTSMMITGAC